MADSHKANWYSRDLQTNVWLRLAYLRHNDTHTGTEKNWTEVDFIRKLVPQALIVVLTGTLASNHGHRHR